ncbi:hypothetical protein AVEN_238779-1 [Araneus ventricosus]|uniref:Secreted protein n=1 Tax=Araneus ventricosus TaxID=182803 RepID=A0A4Y2J1H0_ARAVE|nr:hypothetical protein AVEN_238779-1 [Araneus ventricosus]
MKRFSVLFVALFVVFGTRVDGQRDFGAACAQFKAEVQSVRRACRGRLEHAVEWLSSHAAASRGPPKYKQHADEQLSPFVLSLRLDTPIP